MIKQSVHPLNEPDLSAKYADLCARYEHLVNYNADVESQLIRERADRENLIKKDVLAQLVVEKKTLLDEYPSKEILPPMRVVRWRMHCARIALWPRKAYCSSSRFMPWRR